MMGDMGSVGSLLASLQSVTEITKGIISLRDTAMIQTKVAELNAVVLSAQQSALASQAEQAAMSRRIDALEKQIAEMEAWAAEKERYQLTDFGGGTFAYTLKPDMESGEPAHRICTNCFQNSQKSILQSSGQNHYSQDTYDCPACKTHFNFGNRNDPPALMAASSYDPLEP
ncbi:MAG: hypothetical protein HQ503_08740 [Rhodospirillales bacterium]|nr:hypothetical protein [Rhodospirillales bacterium]